MPDLARALTKLLPAGTVLGVGDLGVGDLTAPESFWPGETLTGAMPKRRAEFSAGRAAARQGLRQLGHPEAAIPMAPDRSPVWPSGIVGSISHCAGACMAVLGLSNSYAGIGLDIEPRVGLPYALWETVLGVEETVAALSSHDALQIFVAKEAVYKAQYPISQTVFDFQTIRITLKYPIFSASFVTAIAPFSVGYTIAGKLAMTENFCAALCSISTA